jgi:hypothetical protein
MSFPDGVREALDNHLVLHAAEVVADIAGRKKISPQYLALAVPGMCHTHVPSRKRKFSDCAFCTRRGNCFAGDEDALDALAEAAAVPEPSQQALKHLDALASAAAEVESKQQDLVAKHLDALAALFAEQLALFRQDVELVVERVKGIVTKKSGDAR